MQSWQASLKHVSKRVAKLARRAARIVLQVMLALGLAALVWLYTRSRDRDTLDQVPIPVQIQLASAHLGQYYLEVNGTTRIVASFSGPPSRLRELRRALQRGQVQVAITLKVPEERLNDSSYRDVIRVEASNIPVPPGVVAVLPDQGGTIPYTVHRLVERHLPVHLEYVGDARITQVKIDPPTVVVRGPKDVVDRMWTINTQACALPAPPENLDSKDSVVQGQGSLVAESEGRPLQTTPKSVTFTCRIRPLQKIYELSDIPVQFLCPPSCPWRARFATPAAGRIALVIKGPASEEPPPVLAFVDLTGSNVGQGRNLLPVRLQLPRDFQLVSGPAPQVAFFLEPNERTATSSKDE
jgi:hypothetical protein